jgi:hypothetical protein
VSLFRKFWQGAAPPAGRGKRPSTPKSAPGAESYLIWSNSHGGWMNATRRWFTTAPNKAGRFPR